MDYGTIKVETIARDDFTMLAVKNLPLTISCESPIKVALHTTDMRASTVVPLIGKNWDVKVAPYDAGNGYELGLGSSNGKNIGAWAMWMEQDSIKADGKSVDVIVINGMPTETNSVWSKSGTGTTWLAQSGDHYKSWAESSTLTPVAFTNLTGTLSVQAGINKGSELDLTKAVHLDGMATIQVFYL